MEPVQIFSWFPPSKCVTPVMRKLIGIPLIALVVMLGLVAYWAYDRVEPVKILSQPHIPQVQPGETVLIEASVWRDLSPLCSVDVSRVIITASGYRFPSEMFTYSKAALHAIALRAPNLLRVAVRVPEGVPKGSATLHTRLEYRCNPLDRFWPITTTTELHFEVI